MYEDVSLYVCIIGALVDKFREKVGESKLVLGG